MSDSVPERLAREATPIFVNRPCTHNIPRTMDCLPCVEDVVAAAIRDALDEAAKVAREWQTTTDGLAWTAETVRDDIAAAIESLKG